MEKKSFIPRSSKKNSDDGVLSPMADEPKTSGNSDGVSHKQQRKRCDRIRKQQQANKVGTNCTKKIGTNESKTHSSLVSRGETNMAYLGLAAVQRQQANNSRRQAARKLSHRDKVDQKAI